MKRIASPLLAGAVLCLAAIVCAESPKTVFPVETLKARDSALTVAVGDIAPDFTLPAINGTQVTLSDFREKKNVVLSFVPAAWTPVCSQQWPGYNLALELFREHDTELLGISVDNLPTLYAWTEQMGGIDFPVLSDFWPHGAVARSYGVLRSDGTAERALILIDRQGLIRFIDVHDINLRPDLAEIVREMEKVNETRE